MTDVARGAIRLPSELLIPTPAAPAPVDVPASADLPVLADVTTISELSTTVRARHTTLEEMAADAGLASIEILEWRDLEHPEAGGSEVHAARIAQRWAAAGIDLVVRASRAPGAQSRTSYDGYRVERPAGRYGVFPRVAAGGLRRSGTRPDGLVEVWNGMPFLSPLWSRGPRMALIHHVHDEMWDLVLPGPLALLGKNMERRLAPPLYRKTPVVTLSGSSRSTIIDLLGLPPENVTVVPPGTPSWWPWAGLSGTSVSTCWWNCWSGYRSECPRYER
jgi:hypothetical protein